MVKSGFCRGFRNYLNPRSTDGYAVAEFAVVIPAIVFVAFMGLWSINVAANEVRLHELAVDNVRAAARGDDVASRLQELNRQGVTTDLSSTGNSLTLQLSEKVSIVLPGLHRSINLRANATAMQEVTTNG